MVEVVEDAAAGGPLGVFGGVAGHLTQYQARPRRQGRAVRHPVEVQTRAKTGRIAHAYIKQDRPY